MQLIQSATVQGLNTYTYTLPNTDSYTVRGTLQLPNIVPSALQGPGGGAGTGTGGGIQVASQVVTVVKHNNTTLYTSNAGDRGFLVGFPATAGDTVSFIMSSSLSQDQQPNAVQLTFTIDEGEAL
jgi:hypothetical protein